MVTLNGKYVLDRRLGGGGMAEVHLAHTVGAEGFTRTVAIKRVVSGFAEDPRFAAMFVSEAQLTSKLAHSNIVSVLDFDRDEHGRPYLVMELVDGPSLDELRDTGMLPMPAIVHLATEVLRGLGYAHALPVTSDGVRGVVHRDISPHNVLLSWEGAVKVSDFGIAKARAASSVTASDTIKGKPAYMSPEQANGDSLDGRSDLFAVGVMLWELLCGRELFSGQTTQETLARLMFAPIPSPRELRPEVPEDLAELTMRLLARDRSERPATAGEAIAELVACSEHPRSGRELLIALLAERFVDRAPKRDAPSSEVPTVTNPRPQTRLPGPLDAVRPAPAKRDRWPWLALGVVAAVGGAVGLVLANRDQATLLPPDASAPAVVGAVDLAAKLREAKPLDLPVGDSKSKDQVRANQRAGKGNAFAVARPTAFDPYAYYQVAKTMAENLIGRSRLSLIRWRGFDRSGLIDVTMTGSHAEYVFAGYETPSDGSCFVTITIERGAGELMIGSTTDGSPCSGGVPVPNCTGAQLFARAVAGGMPEDAVQVSAFLVGSGWNVSAGEFSMQIFNKTCE
ncbi:MAG: serine/threonine-protein kinase [Kofleriaceae bacterium]